MIEYFQTHQAGFWFLVGFGLLAIEIVVFGMASGVLLFGGLGALVTGAIFWLGWLPGGWLAGVACFAVASSASALLLWWPLKKLQSGSSLGDDRSSDLIGLEFRLQSPVTVQVPGKHRYSGVDWRVEVDSTTSDKSLHEGELVRVNKVNAGVFHVVPAEPGRSS